MLQKANGYPSVQAWVQDQVQAAIPQLDRYKEEANNSRSAATNLTSTNNNILTNKTSAANNAATNARVASEGVLNRGVTIAGQDKSDARARELNKITADNKPLTEGQSKSALFGTRMSMANQIFDTLEKSGTTTSTPGMNSGYGVGSVVNAL